MNLHRSIERNERRENFEISSEHCTAKLGKGESVEKMPSHVLVMDTGLPWMPAFEQRHPKTQEELDALYRETIKRGIIDHHGIDTAVLDLPKGVTRRCATKMVADFAPEVLEQINERDIREVTGHYDSDLDAISSTYLAQALVQSRDVNKMPRITAALAEHANMIDYGQFAETDPDKYAQSLQGLFGGLKRVLSDAQRAEMGKVWSSDAPIQDKRMQATSIAEKWNKGLVDGSFEILNACEAQAAEGDIDLKALDIKTLPISEKMREHLQRGVDLSKQEFRDFNEAFASAERTITTVMTKEGNTISVPMIIFRGCDKLSPLVITNMCYSRLPPETIVAVFAGPDRKHGGDQYDIGIKQETTALFDLNALVKPFNEAEERARKRVFTFSGLEALAAGVEEPNEEQKAILARFKLDAKGLSERWSKLRPGFEWTGHGDPTVAVAGGSLLAASNTSLLTVDEFTEILSRVNASKTESA